MAEVAAGAGVAIAAEEVVSRGAEVGLAAYMIAKPTMPLKATYTRIATADDDPSRRSLSRSNHTLTVISNKAYIFGGETDHDDVASNDIHAITIASTGKPDVDYSLIPAVPVETPTTTTAAVNDSNVPPARTKHAACAFNDSLAIYGGFSTTGDLLREASTIWLFHPAQSAWSHLDTTDLQFGPGPRSSPKLFATKTTLIIYGGKGPNGEDLSDVWRIDPLERTWEQLPNAPVSTSNAAFTEDDGQLYLISGSDPMSSSLHHIDLSVPVEDMKWDTFTFPTNPVAPGPQPRHDAGLLPITTGYGRRYLVYFLGSKEKPKDALPPPPEDDTHDVTQWSDIWTLQIPSSSLQPQASLSFSKAIKPAKIKDAIRSALGVESGQHTWAEAVVQPPPDFEIPEGKVHPGPRGFFGADVAGDGCTVVFWGGQDAKGERVGDGWTVKLE
ncbi:hypothetical protein BU24DRAFT_491969 [Aaosphaeria arxii CBS 175.79]|uniref:Galactose oxidase n=1 Tax=Aaosphaeria arxii CBS 175.79 TaxID=1450172 RepID=A0A6A5XSU3_9PLEO|nr:uncharacterized protein BU24DRAFT_491969 [Aaosphaeria arxii CBS 175.79]KAF2015760.1 hypothetical protein BU24DRAFT_491969 [Aaosphaeria arxii CBS 175.79]